MPASVSEERFDWRGPAARTRQRSLFRKLLEQVIPPKGQKVLPTASGMLLIFIGLTIGLAAYNTENNILFAALSLLIASLILSGIVCWVNFLSARWRLETSSTFRVGEEGTATVVVENARQRFPLHCLSFSLESEAVEDEKRVYLKESLNPGESTQLLWRFKPTRRMKASISVRDVVSSFPFGFLTKYIAGECEALVTVWPKRVAYVPSRNPGSVGSLQGRSSKKKGHSGELIGLRQYQRGDAQRDIHWKVSAKQGRLIVKQNASETQAIFRVVIDPSEFLWKDAEVFEKMCSFAASYAEDLFLESKLDSCHIVGGSSVQIRRVADLESFLDILSDLEPQKNDSESRDMHVANRIVFKPINSGGVGAFINEIQVAQA